MKLRMSKNAALSVMAVFITCSALMSTVHAEDSPAIEASIEKTRADMAQRGTPLTPQQEAVLRVQYRWLQKIQGAPNGGGLPGGMAQAPAVTANLPVAMTTDALAARVSQLPAPALVQVQTRKDGFELNGIRVMDPEGKISRQSVNAASGDYTYLIEKSDGSRLVKRGRGTEAPAFLIATIAGKPGVWSIRSVDGQSSEGDMYALSPLGLVVMREDAAFELIAGRPIRSFALPAGWNPVPLQRGDISGTRYMLVEKSADARPEKDSLGSLFQGFKRITGAEAADDYALLNLDTGKVVKLAIEIDGKKVTRMSDCRKKNAVVNLCNKAESFESLWGPDGSPNTWHYFWRVVWMDTPEGPMAISNQRLSSEIRLFDLRSGKEVVAFRRPLGIARWAVTPGPAGTFGLAAQLAFTTHKVEDVRKLLDTVADWSGRAAEGTVIAGVAEGASAPVPVPVAVAPSPARVQDPVAAEPAKN